MDLSSCLADQDLKIFKFDGHNSTSRFKNPHHKHKRVQDDHHEDQGFRETPSLQVSCKLRDLSIDFMR